MKNSIGTDHRLCVAPMMEWTDRHCRVFLRCLTQRTLLYTEMVHCGAVVHGDAERHLGHDAIEHPLALQLGGSIPDELAAAARVAESFGYDEINLNVGCPSERVSAGRFGACLMAEPELVRDCVGAMIEAVSVPITVKSRIGIDDRDSYEELAGFVATVAQSGCKTFIIHARKALLSGLSPKQNREIPPLEHDRVMRLKSDFPDLEIILNGGVQSIGEALSHLDHVNGVMIGRAAYQDPWLLRDADRCIFGGGSGPSSRHAVVNSMLPYIDSKCRAGVPLARITRHMLGLFNGVPGARSWRRYLSEQGSRVDAGVETVLAAAELVADPAVSGHAEVRSADPAPTLQGDAMGTVITKHMSTGPVAGKS
ncbi:MAG: tRNA dihydrouridine(20/20a) synthase DusA [Rhodospirillales bacterium]|nr:MAG: tRNA dihydrouridine(20/20a) synthase DusA [Rhodospirillales bacterium]